jgi:hypothetical protein
MALNYWIRVKGHLDPSWSAWFGDLSIMHDASGDTVLAGPLPDQAALYGLLEKARNLNLRLVGVGEVPPAPSDDGAPMGAHCSPPP